MIVLLNYSTCLKCCMKTTNACSAKEVVLPFSIVDAFLTIKQAAIVITAHPRFNCFKKHAEKFCV